jgi:hypothetical protein
VRRCKFAVESIDPVADKAAVGFHLAVTLAGGGGMRMRGAEVFTVTDEELISSVTASWGDDDVEFGEALG